MKKRKDDAKAAELERMGRAAAQINDASDTQVITAFEEQLLLTRVKLDDFENCLKRFC